ncbi:Asp23/Gls24 family envelope stress response protein [Leifsonia sp. 21MFCrub1.1]|uniref:Asp23/Gls24 family envelope stress response protein n=1 Tax=Leifsonia sp. 21MFCrub1.1 TaxID=1798223 RepID=UPI0008928D42|nr:Asp23/Gls24 family envelope stress response protein [Leifsonia sp. 21MFCrub1.1]SEA38825.1 Asp23 family, cell envelope-related function [Leifsonia sp. 21MFCrub1.1]
MTDPYLPGDELIDGHTLDELSDYLARGRTPADPSIDGSPECRAALASLERLSRTTMELMEVEAERSPTDDGWVSRILDGIRLDVQSGRRVPLSHPDETADLALTEGAVRALVRDVGDGIDGVIVGRCRLDGDLETLGSPVAVHVEISVRYGDPLEAVAAEVRAAVAAELAAHAELNVASVDVTVTDVRAGRAQDGGPA